MYSELRDDSDLTSASRAQTRVGLPLDMEAVCSSNRDRECYFPGEDYYWVNLGKYTFTSNRCQPGDRMVVDIVTGEARINTGSTLRAPRLLTYGLKDWA